jgi:hypothetical protein
MLSGRLKILKREALKKQKSIVDRISQILNLGAVHSLNAQQQASFLRDIDTKSRGGRRLAKLHYDRNSTTEGDLKTIFEAGVEELLKMFPEGVPESENEGEDPTSFYSLNCNRYCSQTYFFEFLDFFKIKISVVIFFRVEVQEIFFWLTFFLVDIFFGCHFFWFLLVIRVQGCGSRMLERRSSNALVVGSFGALAMRRNGRSLFPRKAGGLS